MRFKFGDTVGNGSLRVLNTISHLDGGLDLGDMLYPTSSTGYRLFTIAKAVDLLRGGGGLRFRRRRPVAVSRGR